MKLNPKLKKQNINMKKQIAIAILLFYSIGINAQVTKEDLDKEIKPLTEKVNTLQSQNSRLKSEIGTLNSKLSTANKSIDSLKTKTKDNNTAITQTANQLGIQIKETGDKNEGKITEVSESLSKKSLYGIIGVLAAILLSGLLYLLLSKKQKADKTDVEGQLSQTRKTIAEEQIQINIKLAELYNGQMELIKVERKSNPNNGEIDHSLPLKVADEIVKMQMNLAHMDSKIKGHRHLSIAVTNVFDNFKANGYEIIDHLNKPYNDGMNMQATKEPDPTLKEGVQIIRRVIKPEIYFNNKIIQHAQVIVAYGE
jgi:cell division septum initiation protein DivIVA